MSMLLPLDDLKYRRIFTWWGIGLSVLSLWIVYLYCSSEILNIKGDNPGWLNVLYALFTTCVGLIGPIIGIEFSNNALDARKRNLLFLGMLLVLFIQVACIIMLKAFCPTLTPGNINSAKTGSVADKSDSTAQAKAPSPFRNDPSLFHLGFRNYTTGYVVVEDSISVNGLDLATYEARKTKFRLDLLRRCDDKLQQAGFPMVSDMLIPLLQDVNENRPLIEELNRFQFFFLDEQIDPNAHYKASMCIAKDRSMDSILAVIRSKICIYQVLRRQIFKQDNLDKGMEITLQQIVHAICSACPSSPFVEQIKKSCGNTTDCDSIYFESGEYNISQATQLILDCFYTEFKKKYQQPCSIDFYGFTDDRPVNNKGIYYNGNGAYTDLFSLLPDVHHADTLLSKDRITDNRKLSFARAYSCFNYLRPYKRSTDEFHYSGGGVGNFDKNANRLRTVKIVITKQ